MIVTPYTFGAVGDGFTDDSTALQAFFDDAAITANRRKHVYDWRGKWAVSKTIYAICPYVAEEPTGNFICGRIKVMAVSAQPGGVPMTDVLVIAGYRNQWSGTLYIDGFTDANELTSYDYRRFVDGVRLNSCSGCTFETIRVDGAKRDSVKLDTNGATFRAGTPAETTFVDSNNIALLVGMIYSRGCGSCNHQESLGHRVSFTLIGHGGHPGASYDPTTAAYNSSVNQRSLLNVSSTAELRASDYGKVRLELGPATYGTIAASNTAGTLTWSSGDPVAAGLVVGEKFTLRSGANAYQEFEIVGFSGTSNRTIAVWPKPASEAAAAITALWTKFSIHWIATINSATQMEVFPWVSSRHATGTWYSMHGWSLNAPGPQTANLTVGLVGAIQCGGVLNCAGLFGPSVSSVLGENVEITVAQGLSPQAAQLGTVIEHIHSEVAEADFLQLSVARDSSHAILKGASSLYLSRITQLTPRASPTEVLRTAPLFNLTVDAGGQLISSGILPGYSGTPYALGLFGLSNDPKTRLRTIIENGTTIDLNFDDDIARMAAEHHWAELFWISPMGGAPSGTLAFQLSAELSFKGWSMIGATSTTNPGKPCFFKVRFYKEGKKVFLTRFDAV